MRVETEPGPQQDVLVKEREVIVGKKPKLVRQIEARREEMNAEIRKQVDFLMWKGC